MYHTHSVMYNVEDVIMESDGTHTKIIAEYGIDDNRISVTGEVYYERQDNDGPFFSSEPDEIGQVHDHIAKAFPWLRPLIDLQLVSVDTGAPIYALDNGWYWLSGHTIDPNDIVINDDSRQDAAQYLRTTPDMLESISTKEELNNLIETTLAPAWKRQVDATLKLFNLPIKTPLNKNLDSVHIVYTDDKGCLYDQPLSDLPDVGTLIDPDSGDDMAIVGYKLV